MSENFIKLTRLLSTNEVWINARPTHQSVFLAIILRMAFKETKQDSSGHSVTIKPCQLHVAQRKLAEWASKWITRDDVIGALAYFTKHKFLLHEVLHGKSFITIIESEVCECFIGVSPPRSPQQFLHDSSTIPPQKKKEKKEKNVKEEKQQTRENGVVISFNEYQEAQEEENEIVKKALRSCEEIVENTQHNVYNETDVTKPIKELTGIDKLRELVKKDNNISDNANELCDYFRQARLKSFPELSKESIGEEYACDFDELLKNHLIDHIKQVIDFGFNNDFWSPYLLKIRIFKSKFTTLFALMIKESKKGKTKDNEKIEIDVELMESRKLFAQNQIKRNWSKFTSEIKPRVMPDCVWIGDDKIYFKEEKFNEIFTNSIRKAMEKECALV